jgi:hypothetical protein
MEDNAFTPKRILDAIEVLLAQLSATLAPELTEDDGGADRLKIKIDGYKEKAARLKTVLSKAQAASRRRKEIDRENRQNTRRPKLDELLTSEKTRRVNPPYTHL